MPALAPSHESTLREWLLAAPESRACLQTLHEYGPPEAWLAAGFIRNAVFTRLFGPSRVELPVDLDVIYLDPHNMDRARDEDFTRALSAQHVAPWSVKNQARMAIRNGHGSYRDIDAAISHFPETATVVAVRFTREGQLEIRAPLGLDDLFAGVIVASPGVPAALFAQRCAQKRWQERWPAVRVVHA
jgi:hypothetical protein